MWFTALSILLITIPNLQGYTDIRFKEIHYKISKTVAKIVEESKLVPDPSELEQVEKTKTLLEEYIQIDISSGLPEQIALLELKEKADDVKTNEQTRKAIMDGLELLEYTGEMKMDGVIELRDTVSDELNKVTSQQTNLVDPYSNLEDVVDKLRKDIVNFEAIRRGAERSSKSSSDKTTILTINELAIIFFNNEYERFFEKYDKVEKYHPISFDLPKVVGKVMDEGNRKCEKIRKLKEEFEFPQNLLSVKREIQVMEELRDSEAIQNMLKLIEKLEGSFEGIQGSGLEKLISRISYFLRKMTPIRNHLKTLKISPGDLAEPLRKIESCLQRHNFSMSFKTEKEGLVKIEDTFEEIRALNKQYLKTLDKVEEFRKAGPTIKKMMKFYERRQSDWNWDEFMKLLMDLGKSADEEQLYMVPNLGSKLSKIKELVNKLNVTQILAVTNEVSLNIQHMNIFLKCYTAMRTQPANIELLMDQPKKVWNFDPRSLENAVEVVYLFKEAYRFLADQKPATANEFPLTREEVTEVTDGFAVLESIRNFQKFWTKNSGNFSSTLADELSHVEDISNIQFSTDPQLDSIIDFYRTQYQGGQRTWILKTLEGVKDTSEFAEKLEKMNEGIRKYLGPEPQVIEEELLVDCFERTCSLTLPILKSL